MDELYLTLRSGLPYIFTSEKQANQDRSEIQKISLEHIVC